MNVVATADNNKTRATISNCPASRPKLNANNGETRFSSAPNNDLSRNENPSPWIKPKKSAAEYRHPGCKGDCCFSPARFIPQVSTMVTGIKNSIQRVLT